MAFVGLSSYRWNNNLKSIGLLTAFPVLLLLLVGVAFYIYGLCIAHDVGYIDPVYFTMFGVSQTEIVRFSIPQTPYVFAMAAMNTYWPYVLGFAALWVFIGYAFNGAMIRAVTGAHAVTRTEEPKLYNLLENLCISRGIATPKLYVIETEGLNAFASGIDKASYAVTVTRGILDKMTDAELEAVLGHELTHILNGDCRLLIVTVVFVGMLSFIAQLLWRNMARVTRGSRSNRNGKGTALFMLIAGVVMILGYFLALLLRFALSRRREYMADAGAVELTKNPEGMASALRKIAGACDVPHTPSEVRQMFIENPPSLYDMGGLFATHPPIEARIEVLEQLAGATLATRGESIIPPSR